MTFFYDLNKKLADIDAKQQLNEDTQVNEKYMGFSKLEREIARRGDVRDPGAVAASIGRKKYGKEKFQKAAAAGQKMGEARHPQELDYQQGPEDDEEYRRHHGLDDPDRQHERKLRATDHKTLDRLERQAVNRAKQMDEQDIDEVSRGEYIQQQDTKAERTGKDKFKAFGQTFDTDEVDEGRNDSSPLDDPLTRFRKKKFRSWIPNTVRERKLHMVAARKRTRTTRMAKRKPNPQVKSAAVVVLRAANVPSAPKVLQDAQSC